MKKILLLLVCLVLPIIVFADSGANYSDSVHYVNNYIHTFEKYNSYLHFKDKLEYVYEDGAYSYNPDFKSGGLLSKTEYEISNRKNNTWLSNGLEYWTLSKSSGGRHFVLNYRLQEKLDTAQSGVRVTEYVKKNTAVVGAGSYADPWQFTEVLNLHLNSTNIIRGKVSSAPCSDASMQKETVTLTFASGSQGEAYICPASGYTVYTNSCSGYMIKDANNKYIVSGVSKDNLICNISFTYTTTQVNLSCPNCTTNPSPSVVYSNKVHDLWFNNKNGLDETKITKLTTNPTKTGYTYKGYHKDGTLIINTSGVFQDDATSLINGTTTLNPTFEANTYQYTLSIANPTSTNHTTSGTVVYDSNIATIISPQRVYTITYNANGGTVARTQDTITHTFDGYFYNGTKYINTNGTSARTWNIASNATLTGSWSGGTVSFPTATRVGYKLVGWYTGDGTKIENNSIITQNLSLTAKWEAIDVNYTVKHYQENIDGSYATPTVETFQAKTASTVTPAVKTYTGFDSPSTQSAVVNGAGDTVIEYKYNRKKYTVSISRNNTNYGTIDKTSLTIKHGTTYSSSGTTLSFNDGQKVTATITNVTGYTTTFSNWSPSSGTITGATTITANFARTPIKYTYTFTSSNASYGTVDKSSVSVAYDSTYSVSGNVFTFSDGQKVTAAATAKTGYTTTFGSWSSTSGTVKGAGSVSASFTRTANTYTIAYNCNGGSGTISSTSHTYDVSKAITSSVCTRSGFDFNGWNTKSDGSGTSYSSGQAVSNLSATQGATVTLYAKWKDVSAPTCKLKATTSGVTFDSKTDNVGVASFGLIKSTTATYNSTTTLSLSNGTFYGYVKDAAGNTGSCSITIGGTYVSSYNKTTKTCNRSVANYTKTTQTCNRSVANYTKTTKTCNSYVSSYTKTIKTCNSSVANYTKTQKYCGRSVSSYTRTLKNCVGSISSYIKTTAKCNASYSGTCSCRSTSSSQPYSYSCGSYSSCSSRCSAAGYGFSSGSCTLSTSWSTSNSTVSSCSTSSYFTCNIKANGSSYVQSCSPQYSYAFQTSTSTVSSCSTQSSFSCVSSQGGNSYVSACSANYSYSLGSASTSTVSSCSANTFTCNSSNYGSYYTTCSANYSYSYGTSTSSGSSCSTESLPGCNAAYAGRSYVTGCSANYGYSFGSTSTSTVSSCSANNISCSSSTSGQTHVACTTNYNYSFGSSTSTASSCSTQSSFTCNSGNYGSSYVSGCSTNYSYDFGSSTSTASSCSTGSSFTCNSSNYGASYVSGCSAAAYACSNSGYTKINDSYCYSY